jgi:hypothetical protein
MEDKPECYLVNMLMYMYWRTLSCPLTFICDIRQDLVDVEVTDDDDDGDDYDGMYFDDFDDMTDVKDDVADEVKGEDDKADVPKKVEWELETSSDEDI